MAISVLILPLFFVTPTLKSSPIGHPLDNACA